MRRLLLLAITLFVTINFLLSPAVRTQQPQEDKLPNMEDYPPAGANCKVKQQLAPSLGMPIAGPGKFRCQIKVYNCKTDNIDEYTSSPRDGGEGMCADYDRAKTTLQERVICCREGLDPAPPVPAPLPAPPTPTPEAKKKCEQPTPWFGSSSACRDVQSPEIKDSGGKMPLVTLYICGLDVFHDFPPKDFPGGVVQYKAGLASFVKQRVGSKVCCEKLREAVRTKKPCDPTDDIDCDGNRNTNEFTKLSKFPDINNLFTTPEGAPVDPLPRGLNPDDTEFFPPQDKCDCKWELAKGTLTCSPDGRQPHVYQARWRCPSTGNERFTRKEAPATERCRPS